MDSSSSLILAQPVDDKGVSESASKMTNDKCGGAFAEGVDLESGSDCGVTSDHLLDWCHPHPTLSNRGLQKCQMDIFVISVKNVWLAGSETGKKAKDAQHAC